MNETLALSRVGRMFNDLQVTDPVRIRRKSTSPTGSTTSSQGRRTSISEHQHSHSPVYIHPPHVVEVRRDSTGCHLHSPSPPASRQSSMARDSSPRRSTSPTFRFSAGRLSSSSSPVRLSTLRSSWEPTGSRRSSSEYSSVLKGPRRESLAVHSSGWKTPSRRDSYSSDDGRRDSSARKFSTDSLDIGRRDSTTRFLRRRSTLPDDSIILEEDEFGVRAKE